MLDNIKNNAIAIALFVVVGVLFFGAGTVFKGCNGNKPSNTPSVPPDKFVIPSTAITGKTNVNEGQLVTLKVDSPSPVQHLTQAVYQWAVFVDGDLSEDFVLSDNNTKIVLLARKNTILVISPAYIYEVKDGEALTEVAVRQGKLGIVKLNVSGDGTSTPEPSKLDGFAKFTHDSFVENVTVERVKAASRFAEVFNSVANSIGKYNDLESVMDATSTLNNVGLKGAGLDPDNYKAWAKVLQGKLFEKYKNQELETLPQIKAVWLEIAKGLEAVK